MGGWEIFQAVLEFNGAKVRELVKTELTAGTNLEAILNEGLISAMDEVGRRFSEGVMYVPEMLQAARAMKAGLEELRPHLSAGKATPTATIVIGTVAGDLHDIGKNLVSMMLEGAGFRVVDLGVNVTPDQFVHAGQSERADLIALSALLTTTMPAMEKTIAAIKEHGTVLQTMVGGAPVTKNFATMIGADGYAADAPGAVELARQLTRSIRKIQDPGK